MKLQKGCQIAYIERSLLMKDIASIVDVSDGQGGSWKEIKNPAPAGFAIRYGLQRLLKAPNLWYDLDKQHLTPMLGLLLIVELF